LPCLAVRAAFAGDGTTFRVGWWARRVRAALRAMVLPFRGRPLSACCLAGREGFEEAARVLHAGAPGDRPRRLGLVFLRARSVLRDRRLRAPPGLLDVCPSGGRSFTPARRALERPMAIACFVDRAPCLPLRMCSIVSFTNSRPVVDGASPRACLSGSLDGFFSGMGLPLRSRTDEEELDHGASQVNCEYRFAEKGAKMA